MLAGKPANLPNPMDTRRKLAKQHRRRRTQPRGRIANNANQ